MFVQHGWTFDGHACIFLAHNEETLRYLASIYASSHPVMHSGYPGCVNGLGRDERQIISWMERTTTTYICLA